MEVETGGRGSVFRKERHKKGGGTGNGVITKRVSYVQNAIIVPLPSRQSPETYTCGFSGRDVGHYAWLAREGVVGWWVSQQIRAS